MSELDKIRAKIDATENRLAETKRANGSEAYLISIQSDLTELRRTLNLLLAQSAPTPGGSIERPSYIFDLDGTILFRGKASSYPTADRLPNSLEESDLVSGDLFEGRPVYFTMNKKRYPIWFRSGIHQLLTMLSDNGNNRIYIATHACAAYAGRVASYLRARVANMVMIVMSFPKDQHKHVNFAYKFIVEDHPERWLPNTSRIVAVPPLTQNTADTDAMLLGLSVTLNREKFPDVLIISIVEYAKKAIENVVKCNDCKHWRVSTESYCHSCSLGETFTDNSEDFESADGVGENGKVVDEKGGYG